MTKKIEDIVERAKQVADLQNSNYISDKEIEFLLNESYDKVYADLINIGDRYFLKTFVGSGHDIALPEDFMVLNAVIVKDIPLLRKPNNINANSNYGGYYDLNQDHIHLLGSTLGPATIEYYPVPEQIVWPIVYPEEGEDFEPITDLTLPNNVAFTYFSYVMAMKMKMKQGADITLIQALAAEQLELYIQLQHRDGFGVTRVTNVYNGGLF